MTMTTPDTTRRPVGRPPLLTHDELIRWITDNQPTNVHQAVQGLRAEGLGSNPRRVARAFEEASTTMAAAWLAARLARHSWRRITDDFGFAYPSAAQAAFTEATGLTDYQVKGEALARILLAGV